MLRHKLREFVVNHNNHPLIKKFSRLLFFIGILWLASFPYTSRNVFTSENALNGEYLETQFNQDGSVYPTFKNMQEQLRGLPSTSQSHRNFIMEKLGHKTEVYLQELRSKKDKQNIYAYVRSSQGYGNECNLLAMPLNHKASVVTGLTFVETWIKRQPKWQSKDLLILFYEELDYALGVREFLENYFSKEADKRDFFSTRVEGRCGYIRQAYAFQFTEYEFNKFSMFLDGINSQFSDIDFYDASKLALARFDFKFDFSLPYYFQQNTYLDTVSKWLTHYVRNYYMMGLNAFTSTFLEFNTHTKGSMLQMFESIKNQHVGRPHMPHTYMIEHGIHSMTLKGTNDLKVKNSNERERIQKTMGLMEHVFRVNDQLDEQLHAGFYFYLLTSKTTFTSNSVFVYPIVVLLFAYFFYNCLQYYEFVTFELGGHDYYLKSAYVFQGLAFTLGFLTLITPGLILEYMGKAENVRGEFCLGNSSIADQVTKYTLYSVAAAIIGFLLLFKFLQPSGNRFWFSLKCHYFWPNLVLAGSLVVYQFSQSLFMTLFVFPLLQSAASLRHSFKSALGTLLLVSFFTVVTYLTLFGSFVGSGVSNLGHKLIREMILDHQCAGSNTWVYTSLHIVPALIIFVKILTN